MSVHGFQAISTELAPLPIASVGAALVDELPAPPQQPERTALVAPPVQGRKRLWLLFFPFWALVRRWKQWRREERHNRDCFIYPH